MRALIGAAVVSLVLSSLPAPVAAAMRSSSTDDLSPASIPAVPASGANVIALPPGERAAPPSPTVISSCSGTTYDDADPYIVYYAPHPNDYSEVWHANSGTPDYAGTNHGIDENGLNIGGAATASFRFSGTCVSLIYRGQSNTAVVSVSIDGAFFESYDTCANAGYQRTRSYGVGGGNHLITIGYSAMGCGGGYWSGPPDDREWIPNNASALFVDGFIAPGRGTCTVSGFIASPPSPTVTGNPNVTLSASGECGGGLGAWYRFDYQDPVTGVWTLISDYYQNYGSTTWQTCCVARIEPPYMLRVRVKAAGQFPDPPAGYEAESTRTHTITGNENRSGYYFSANPNFAISPLGVNLATGILTLGAQDLAMPGRILGFNFTRFYNGTDRTTGSLGIAWTHSFNWSIDPARYAVGYIDIRRGDGWKDTFNGGGDGCFYYVQSPYAAAGVACRNVDLTWTLMFLDQTKYDFDANGRLTKIREPAGNHIDLAYTGANLERITDTAGRVVTLSYDGAGRITQLTDPLGRHVGYGYDSANRLTTVTDLGGGVWTYAYQTDTQRIASVIDPNGRRRVLNTYDDVARVTRQQEQDPQLVTTYSYGAQTTMTNPRGNTSTWAFDSRGRWTSQSQAGLTQSQILDGLGNRTSFTDRRGHTTSWTYDGKGNVLTRTEPTVSAGTPIWRYDRDSANNITRFTDPANHVTTRTFDPVKNVLLSEVRLFDNATTTYEYGDPANPGLATAIVSPRGGRPTFSYNPDGTLRFRVDPVGAKTSYTYDAAGRQTKMVDPDGNITGIDPLLHTWITDYDDADRVIRQTDPLGDALASAYNLSGDRTSTTDRRGNVTTYAYDGRGLLRQVTQSPATGVTYTTTVARDFNGNATRITQANGVYTDYAYDALNRMMSMTTYPTTSPVTTAYALDANGNVTLKTLSDTAQISLIYDNLDRPTSLSTTNVTQNFTYDLLGHRLSSAQTVSGTLSTWSYGYDDAGRMTSASGPNGAVGYSYDLDDNRSAITTTIAGASHIVSYDRRLDGRITTVHEGAINRISSYGYTPAGRTSQIQLPNGLTRTYGYDRAQRLTSVTNVVGGTHFADFDYTLDGEGNRTNISEELWGITAPSTVDGFSLTYDGLNRLTSMVGTRNENFTFDGASNITSRSGPTATYTIDQANRPTSDGTSSFTWSSTDRFTNRGADSFGYDNLDRLTQATVGGVTSVFSYDADGLLTNRAGGGVTKDFLWDPASYPQRLLAAGSDRVVYGNGPLYLVRGASQDLVVFATDGQGSVRAEFDQYANLTGSWRYALYGQIATANPNGSATPSVLAYTGQLLDPTGLYFLRARWYDPVTARFLTRDPLSSSALSMADAFTYPPNPMIAADPSGLKQDDVAGSAPEEATEESESVDPNVPIEDCNNGNKCGSGDGGGLGGAARSGAEGEGVVYVRTDVKTGEKYVGQSQSESRFRQRQQEHVREHPDSDFEFEILGRARTGEQLDRKEEYYIRQMGGPKNKANPDGLLANKRHQMNDQRYLDAGGDY